nr:uncharacterized protein LOC113731970 isoform X1 [Coffea arabica]
MPLLASASLSWPSGFTSSAKLLTTRSTPLLILTLTPHPLLPVLILTENSQVMLDERRRHSVFIMFVLSSLSSTINISSVTVLQLYAYNNFDSGF